MRLSRNLAAGAIAVCLTSSAMARFDDQESPIPQNPDAQARRRSERLAWNRNTTIEAYDRVGRKDPKWDAAARRAMEAACRKWASHRSWLSEDQIPEVAAASREAIEAGCDDPLVVYLNRRFNYGYPNDYVGNYARAVAEAADTLAASKYPASCKVGALLAAAAELILENPGAIDSRDEVAKRLNAALTFLPELIQTPGLGARDDVYNLCLSYMRHSAAIDGGSYKEVFAKIDETFAKFPHAAAQHKAMKGYFWIRRAWEARGGGYAYRVSEEQFRVFHRLLERAQVELETSWKLDSTRPEAATHMISVAIGLGLPRSEMETWFWRAMEADNDWYDAISAKINFLEPKWHGSAEELVTFARAGFKTGNWDGRIADLPVVVHKRIAESQRSDYLRRPEVWADIRAVFEEFLKKHPDARYARTYYALTAVECGDFAEARRQFDRLGDRFWAGLFRTKADADARYDTIRIREEFAR